MDITRRNILKAGLVAGAAAAMGIPLKKEASAQSVAASDVDKWVKGVCRFCGFGCGLYVGVKNNRVVSIRGNPDAKTNFGFLCAKGATIHRFMYHPDRLTDPMIRNKTTGNFEKATWDQALDLIANKFTDYQKRFGKNSVAYYGSGQCTTEESYTFNKLWKAGFRSNQVEGNPRLCMASAVAAYIQTNGSDEPSGTYADIESAKCFFITGHTPSEAHPIMMRRIWERKKKDPSVKIIVCEPRKTKTSDIADIWLPIDPGTDLGIFHAMAHEIIKNNWHDKEFIGRQARFVDGDNVVTFEDYAKFIQQFDPDTIAKRTRCPAANIRKAAEWFATSGATMSTWCMGVNQRTEGVWANNLIHNLHLLTGNIHKPGADPFSMTGQPNACGGVRETGALSHLLPGCRPVANPAFRAQMEKAWGVPEGTIDPAPGMPTMRMFGSLGGENDDSKSVKAMLISTTNPAHSLPNLKKYLPGMQEAFLVVIEIFPSRTTQFADVVLPAAFLYEKGGVYGCSERRSQLTEKAVNPPGEAKPDIWIAAQLAKRMGHEKLIPWNMDDSMRANEMAWTEYISTTKDTDKTLFGATYKRLRESKEGLQWPVPHETHPGTYKRYVRGMDPNFDRPPFKDRIPSDVPTFFYMDGRGEGRANIFLRPFRGGAEVPDRQYPFWLTTGRIAEQWHTSTMTGRVPEIQRAQPYAYAEIHPTDAKRLRINNGDTVRVTSRRGSNILPARIAEVSLPGVVYIHMHDQHKDRLVNLVCNDAVDPTSNEPEYKVAAVKLERVGGPRDFAADAYLVTSLDDRQNII